MKHFRPFAFIAVVALGASALFGLLRSPERTKATTSLAAFAPPGALLTLEAPNFHALLQDWSHSSEQKRWLASDNYAGFSRSRLFGRLKDAQDEFATSAGLPPDSSFLNGVAGEESFFAWYDIGKLEFLYITRMPADQLKTLPLLALRERYNQRSAGGTAFYVRSEGDAARTVAFAVRGDLLLLATREDLIADALQLLADPAPSTLQHEAWFSAAQAAAPATPGDLRMTLHLASVARSPYFRSYWIQQNITEMKAYSAEVSDLYRSPTEFREERTLLPSDAFHALGGEPVDLAPLLRFVAPGSIYHATASATPEEVLVQMEDKVLTRGSVSYSDVHAAPVADLTVPVAGSDDDLEQRIDEPPAAATSRNVDLGALRETIVAAGPVSMLVFSRASERGQPAAASAGDNVFVPIHTAVALHANSEWHREALQAALTTALAPQLSVNSRAIAWSTVREGSLEWSHVEGPQHLALFVEGKMCVVASDDQTLHAALVAGASGAQGPVVASRRAGADFAAQREPLTALAKVLDHASPRSGPSGNEPPFFSGNLVSLGAAFQDLDSETFTETPGSDTVHQQVIHRWH